MVPFAILGGILFSIWSIWTGAEGPDEIAQILENATEFLRARVEDIERESLSNENQRSNKRKRDEDLQHWVTESRKLLEAAESDLKVVRGNRSFLMCAKKRKFFDRRIEALAGHEMKGDMLWRYGLVDRQGPTRGFYIPVNELIGRVASSSLERLQALLLDDKVGRIAIHGMEGIGKTILMKHLHNCALTWFERFDYVVWVTLSHQFSIKHVQDAIAAAVMCDLSNIDDLSIRAQKLSCMLVGLERIVLFLDDVQEGIFCLEEVGIPVPTEGSAYKLVITTNSSLICGMFDCFQQVKLSPLPEVDAWQLFMHEARINMGSDSLRNIASLLARECCGVPRIIVDVATRMCGIDDICEWRFALFESKSLMKKDELSFQVVIDELATIK